jgi:predicted TIM-barrel fold metal-dependent hydrolase
MLGGGAPFQLERLSLHGAGAPAAAPATVHLDTSSYGRRALELCLETYGPESLVYGSDIPVVDSTPTLRALAELGEDVLATVSSENPGRLFP